MVVSAPVLYDEVKGTFVDFSLKATVESKISPQHNARFRIPACYRSFATPLFQDYDIKCNGCVRTGGRGAGPSVAVGYRR